MVLGQASDYFKALLESGFKVSLTARATTMRNELTSRFQEASAPTIELIGDDWCAVYGLIAHFYGLHYDGHNECSLEPLTVTSDDRGAAYVVYQVDLYVVASKYLVPSLCSAIKSDLEHMLD